MRVSGYKTFYNSLTTVEFSGYKRYLVIRADLFSPKEFDGYKRVMYKQVSGY